MLTNSRKIIIMAVKFTNLILSFSLFLAAAQEIRLMREVPVANTASFEQLPIGIVPEVRQLAVPVIGERILALDAKGQVREWERGLWRKLNVPAGVKKIAAGTEHTILLLDDGTVWTAGENVMGQLGDGTLTKRQEFRQINSLPEVIDIAAGSFYSLALDRSGRVWAWGANWNEAAAGHDRKSVLTPELVPGIEDGQWITVKNDQPFIGRGNGIWSWGRLDYRARATRNSAEPWQLPLASPEFDANPGRVWWPSASNWDRTVPISAAIHAVGWTVAWAESLSSEVTPRPRQTLELSTPSAVVGPTAGSGTFNVIADQPWTAISNDIWLTVSPASGTGNQTLTYSYSANAATAARIATITVAGKSFSLTQVASNGVYTPWGPLGYDVIRTIAGLGPQGFSGDGGPAVSAQMAAPRGVAVDGNGNVYVADSVNHRIRKIAASTGVITTFAGTGTQGFSGDSGPATSAQLYEPSGVAVDAAGNVYIADTANNRIRMVSATTNAITTLAGTGTPGFSGDGGGAVSANLASPLGLAVDGSGNVYVADTFNNRIRKITAATTQISTLAGTGTPGFNGDGGPATASQLQFPIGVAVDTAGNVYVADTSNHRIRKINATTLVITTLAGTGAAGFSGDGGPPASAQLRFPNGVAVDSGGNVYIADTENHRIRKITAATATIGSTAGTGTPGSSGDFGFAVASQLSGPRGLTLDANGSVYIADSTNNRLRFIDYATPLNALSSPAANVAFYSAAGNVGIATTPAGAFWMAAVNVSWLTLSAASGTGAATLGYVVTENPGFSSRVAVINVNGKTHSVRQAGAELSAGVVTVGPLASSGSFNLIAPSVPWSATSSDSWLSVAPPTGLGYQSFTYSVAANTGPTGRTATIFVAGKTLTVTQMASNGNYTPWGLGAPGFIRTIAGNGVRGFSGDNGPATSANLADPQNLAIDANGSVYFTDTRNNRVRKVIAGGGQIVTVAGGGTTLGDGGPATAAAIFTPLCVTVGPDKNIYVTEIGNNRVRMINTVTGVITTVAGGGQSFAEGLLATQVSLNGPAGLAFDPGGNLYLAEYFSHRLLRIDAITQKITIFAGTGIVGFSGDGGPATSATFRNPYGIAIDNNWGVYVSDRNNGRVRKIDAVTGTINSVANVIDPVGVAVDAGGNVYVALHTMGLIQKLDLASGTGVTVAGGGTTLGDGGSAIAANLSLPVGVAVDSQGNLYVGELANQRIRFIEYGSPTVTLRSPAASVPLTAGTGTVDISISPATAPWSASTSANWLTLGTANGAGPGTLTFAYADNPAATSRSAFIYVSSALFIVTQAGVAVSLSPESATVAPAAASGILNLAIQPSLSWIAVSSDNWLTVSPSSGFGSQSLTYSVTANTGTSGRAARITVAGRTFVITQGALNGAYTPWGVLGNGFIRTLAGTGAVGYGGDGGSAAAAILSGPQGIAVAANQNVYFTDTGTRRIRNISSTTGVINTAAGNGQTGSYTEGSTATATPLNDPLGVALDNLGNVYLANYSDRRVAKINSTITTVAGNGQTGFIGDGGLATLARLSGPSGVAIDHNGNIYLADYTNHRVRRVDAQTRVITTFAGTGQPGFSGDGGAAVSARLNLPYGVAVNAAGDVYVADRTNNRIRLITSANGIINTIAGGGASFGDGGPATAAQLSAPLGVAVDLNGNVYVADYGNNRIRKLIAATGAIETVAGGGTALGDGGLATSAKLVNPIGVATDPSGNLYIADTGNNRIRFVDFTSPALAPQPPTLVVGLDPPDVSTTRTFRATASDVNGYSDINRIYFLVNSDTSIPANSCHGYFSRAANAFFLYNDALSATTGPLAPGASATIQNTNCAIIGATSTITQSGTDIQLNITIARQGAYTAGYKNLFLWVVDNSNTGTGWVQTAAWPVAQPPQPPTLPSATPATSATPAQTFTITARDINGAADINRIYFLVNTNTTIPANTCHGFYDRAANAIYLYNDALTALTGPLTPNQSTALTNSQCAVIGATFSVTTTPTDVQLTLPLARVGAFANGTKNLYIWVTDNANAGTGWQQASTWSGYSEQPPTLTAATPPTAATANQIFSLTASDANGSADINRIYFLVNSDTSIPANSCHGFYDRAANAIFLYNNTLTALSGPLAPGSGGTIQNSQCAINGPSTSVNSTATNLQLILNITRQGSYATGTRNLYVWIVDNANLGTGWQQASAWNIGAAQPPTLAAAAPTSASIVVQNFLITARDANGASDINRIYFLVNSDTSIPINSCHGFYDRASNAIFLYNDNLTALTGPLTPGAAGTIQNTNCAINGAVSYVSQTSTDVVVNLNITRQSTFATGTKNLYVWITDNANTGTGWQLASAWTIGTAQPPTLGVVSPATASAVTQTFVFTATDANGATDINRVYFLINANTTIPANSCHGFYDRAGHAFFLYNDSLTALIGPLAPGSAATIQNSNCALNGATSFATPVGNSIQFNLGITRQGAYGTGTRNLYLWATDYANTGTGWVQASTWTL